MKRTRAIVVAAVVVAMFSGGACGRQGSEINEIGLIYEGGATQDKKFKGFLKPGSTWESVGWGSKVYRYRIDQRSFIAAPEGKQRDVGPVQIVTNDDVRMLVEFQMYFKLHWNDAKVMRQFHENLGVKTQAWTDDGWDQMLNEYFAPQIERALEAVGLKHNWRDLYASEEARVAFQNEAVQRVKENLREVIGVGADYFCGPSYTGETDSECGEFTFTVGKPEPANQEIIRAIEAEQTAAAATVAQAQENARIAAQVEGERQVVAIYGAEGAIERERNAVLRSAIESGKVTQIIIDSSGRATVPQPR
ncbi:MAG TPA: SPFH domain-containing protein [Acidimicrobiales bacterium]